MKLVKITEIKDYRITFDISEEEQTVVRVLKPNMPSVEKLMKATGGDYSYCKSLHNILENFIKVVG